jgi:hypothetical protein
VASSLRGKDSHGGRVHQSNQPHGESINFNPHVHGISSTGVFGEEGTFYELESLDTDLLGWLGRFYLGNET